MKRYFCYSRTGKQRYTALTEEDPHGYWVRYDDAREWGRRAVEIARRERLLALSRADKTIPELSVDEILAQAEQEGK